MLDFTPEQLAQLRAEKLDAARKEGRLRRIGGASRESVASDFYTDGEVRYYTLAGWAAEDAKLAEPDSYIVQDGFRMSDASRPTAPTRASDGASTSGVGHAPSLSRAPSGLCGERSGRPVADEPPKGPRVLLSLANGGLKPGWPPIDNELWGKPRLTLWDRIRWYAAVRRWLCLVRGHRFRQERGPLAFPGQHVCDHCGKLANG